MYRNPIFYAVLLTLLSLTSLLTALTYEVAHVGFTLRCDVNKITEHTVNQVDGLNLKEVSQITRKTLIDTGDLIKEAHLVTNKENKMLDGWNLSFTKTLDNLNTLVSHIDDSQGQITNEAVGTLRETTDAMKSVQPLIQNGTQTLATTNATVGDLDKFIKAPNIEATVDNIKQITASGASMLATGDQVEKKATDGYLHPPKSKMKRMWQQIQPWLLVIAKLGAAAA